MFKIPNEVQERINELNELCNKYHRNIPIMDAALTFWALCTNGKGVTR